MTNNKENYIITIEELLVAFEELEALYPRVLPLTMWRAWELATYRHFQLPGQILDLGCGDGRFIQQVWPEAKNIVGVDIDPDAVIRAQKAGIYQRVHLAPAHKIPEKDETFDAVFSNCAMEHMDQIDSVFKDAWRILKPGGIFLFSVVTNYMISWAPLPLFLTTLGLSDRGKTLSTEYVSYHHIVNPFTADEWSNMLLKNDFQINAHIPIVPDTFARAFLIMDQLWHVPYHTSEIGEPFHSYLQSLPDFKDGINDIMKGLLKLSSANGHGAGAIFFAQKGVAK